MGHFRQINPLPTLSGCPAAISPEPSHRSDSTAPGRAREPTGPLSTGSRHREHNWDRRCHLLHGGESGIAVRNVTVALSRTIGGQSGVARAISLRPATFDPHGASLNPDELAQALHECIEPKPVRRRRAREKQPAAVSRSSAARAASGHAAAVPRKGMDSRRFNRLDRNCAASESTAWVRIKSARRCCARFRPAQITIQLDLGRHRLSVPPPSRPPCRSRWEDRRLGPGA